MDLQFAQNYVTPPAYSRAGNPHLLFPANQSPFGINFLFPTTLFGPLSPDDILLYLPRKLSYDLEYLSNSERYWNKGIFSYSPHLLIGGLILAVVWYFYDLPFPSVGMGSPPS